MRQHFLFGLALIGSAMTAPAMAQVGYPCAEDPSAPACVKCLEEMDAMTTDIRDRVCRGTVKVGRKELPPPPDCSFKACPKEFGLYDRCISAARSKLREGGIERLYSRYSALSRQSRSRNCTADALPALSEILETMHSTYGQFNGTSLDGFTKCLNAEIETHEAVLVEYGKSSEVGLNNVGQRRFVNSGMRLLAADKLKGSAHRYGVFLLGEEIQNLKSIVNEDLGFCDEEPS